MSYSNDYSSGEDSFSSISEVSPSLYCPVHNPVVPPSSTYCPIHHYSYPFYVEISHSSIRQEQIQSSPSFQVRSPSKKVPRRFTEEQIRILEEHFYKVNKYLSKESIDELSTRTQLKSSQIRVWFNNKRTREHH